MPDMNVTALIVGSFALGVGYLIGQFHAMKNQIGMTIPPKWRWLLDAAAKAAVRAAMQISEEGATRLEWALVYVEKELEKYHLVVDDVLIRGAIENAWLALKAELETKAGVS